MPPTRLGLWLLSLIGLTVSARSMLGHPPPVPAVLSLLVALAVLATVGVFFPGLGVYADVVCRGSVGQRRIALTFDDGPHPESTRAVLATLAEHGARATFFVVGKKVKRHPEILREIVAAGHTIGLHGYDHDRLYSLRSVKFVLQDIARSQDEIERACGVRPTLLRPPVGFVSHAVGIAAEKAGVTLVGWSRRGFDGTRGSVEERVLAHMTKGLSDGAILLLHDAAEREDFNPVAPALLPALLREIARHELRTVTIDEFFAPVQDAGGSSMTKRAPG